MYVLVCRWCSFQVVDDVTEVQVTGDFQDAGPGSIDQATFQLLAALSEKEHMLPEALRLKVRASAATRFPAKATFPPSVLGYPLFTMRFQVAYGRNGSPGSRCCRRGPC